MSAAKASPTIRPAETSDAEAACNVLRRSIVELCQEDYENRPGRLDQWLANKTPDHVRRWIDDDRLDVYVAMRGKDIAGVAGLGTTGVGTANAILLNYVDPDHRFAGVSSALLDHMEQVAARRGAKQVRLESTKTAHRFYTARGYNADPANQDASRLWMIKTLAFE